MPRVAAVWQEVYGSKLNIDRLYKDFIPYQNSIPKCSALIPGALETFENIKSVVQNWQYTGYASMMIGRLVKDCCRSGLSTRLYRYCQRREIWPSIS
jgi:phosphonoacetaldehyde hydrolase